jgi:hypothetical protein
MNARQGGERIALPFVRTNGSAIMLDRLEEQTAEIAANLGAIGHHQP